MSGGGGVGQSSSSSHQNSRVTLTSDEVNVLVYRYLLDSGFRHAAYVFQSESQLHRSPLVSVEIAPGALVTYLQKGLLYLYLETHVTEDGQPLNCAEHFSLLRPHEHAVVPATAAAAVPAPVQQAKLVPDYDKLLHRNMPQAMEIEQPSQQISAQPRPAGSTPGTAAVPATAAAAAASQAPVISAIAAGKLPMRTSGTVGNFVAALTLDGRVTACDLSTGAVQLMQPQMPEISDHGEAMAEIALAPEGCVLATHSRRGLAVWEIGNQRCLEITGAHISGCMLPRWAPGARRFSVLTPSRSLAVFSRGSNSRFEKFPITLPLDKGNPLDVLWVSGNFLLVGLDTGKFLVFEISDQNEISAVGEVATNHQIAFRLVLSPQKQLAVAGNFGVDIFEVEISSGNFAATHRFSLQGGHKDLVSELVWSEISSSGNFLATACDGGVVNVWSGSAGTRLTTWTETPAISALAWAETAQTCHLVVGLERGKVRVYDGVSGNFCEEIGNEDLQVDDVGAVVDELTGTAFLVVLGVNSRSLRVASRKLDGWRKSQTLLSEAKMDEK